MRLTILAALAAFPAHAADEFTLEVHGEDHASVSFYNSHPPNSMFFPETLTNGGLTVGIHVHIGTGPETIEVHPPEGWVAIPPMLDVIDGEIGTVELRRGEYLGF